MRRRKKQQFDYKASSDRDLLIDMHGKVEVMHDANMPKRISSLEMSRAQFLMAIAVALYFFGPTIQNCLIKQMT